MSAPTQAQIEAAARELKRHTMPDGYSQPQRWLDIAAAAITAAVEAGEHTYTQSQLDNAVKQTWSATIERCIQAAKNVRPCGTPKLMRESIIAAIRAMKDESSVR